MMKTWLLQVTDRMALICDDLHSVHVQCANLSILIATVSPMEQQMVTWLRG